MTALPERPHLFTIEEYVQLGETENGYTELVEGRLILSPSPVFDHNNANTRLTLQLSAQLPGDLVIAQDLDIDMEFAPADKPGSSRRPDLFIVPRTAIERVRREGNLVRASELLLVVEIVSPGSRRMDNVIKRHEYAEAGIPHYWIIDVTEPVSMIVCHQAGPFGYQDSGELTGKYEISDPFNVIIDLNQLRSF